MTHIIIIVPAASYGSLPAESQSQFVEMIRAFLIDKSSNPMQGVSMMRGADLVYVGAYWTAHTTGLSGEVIAAVNVQLSPIGVKVIECDDIQGALASEGIAAIEQVIVGLWGPSN